MSKCFLLPAILSALSLCCCGRLTSAGQPNIIVFYTDDHGHADLGVQGVVEDIKTPYTDALARAGARMVHGYSTAPQCVPSRGGLLIGRFQSRFGLEDNGSSLDGFNAQSTIAQRLQRAGYVTAQFGKWHLGPAAEIPRHGFTHVFAQNASRPFTANITLDGRDRPLSDLKNEMYHVDGCAHAAAALIERYSDQPFFLYIAFRAPHVPLDAPASYLARFPGEMPERRRQALAMISAMDDGVGLITETLARHALSERTLIFYIGDNGAPLKIHKADEPGGGPGWDGSLNDPLNGEKGMLSEGGIHVPYLVAWPGVIPAGQSYPHPVSTLDVAATAVSLAGIATDPSELDGVNLIPYLAGENTTPPHEALYWRWGAQAAVRQGDWKLLRGGNREYLYQLADDLDEQHNLAAKHPEIADRLRAQLQSWTDQLQPPGLAAGPMTPNANHYFDFYLEGKPAPPLHHKPQSGNATRSNLQDWQARNGTLAVRDGVLQATGLKNVKSFFITRSGLKLVGPVRIGLDLKVDHPAQVAIAWRVAGDRDFQGENRITFPVVASADWQSQEIALPASGTVIHLRLHLPARSIGIRTIQAITSDGQAVSLWKWMS